MISTRSQKRDDEVQVVADEDQPHAAVAHEIVHDAQDLAADRDVQRAGRLVRDQDLGPGASIIAIMMRWPMPPDTSCG